MLVKYFASKSPESSASTGILRATGSRKVFFLTKSSIWLNAPMFRAYNYFRIGEYYETLEEDGVQKPLPWKSTDEFLKHLASFDIHLMLDTTFERLISVDFVKADNVQLLILDDVHKIILTEDGSLDCYTRIIRKLRSSGLTKNSPNLGLSANILIEDVSSRVFECMIGKIEAALGCTGKTYFRISKYSIQCGIRVKYFPSMFMDRFDEVGQDANLSSHCHNFIPNLVDTKLSEKVYLVTHEMLSQAITDVLLLFGTLGEWCAIKLIDLFNREIIDTITLLNATKFSKFTTLELIRMSILEYLPNNVTRKLESPLERSKGVKNEKLSLAEVLSLISPKMHLLGSLLCYYLTELRSSGVSPLQSTFPANVCSLIYVERRSVRILAAWIGELAQLTADMAPQNAFTYLLPDYVFLRDEDRASDTSALYFQKQQQMSLHKIFYYRRQEEVLKRFRFAHNDEPSESDHQKVVYKRLSPIAHTKKPTSAPRQNAKCADSSYSQDSNATPSTAKQDLAPLDYHVITIYEPQDNHRNRVTCSRTSTFQFVLQKVANAYRNRNLIGLTMTRVNTNEQIEGAALLTRLGEAEPPVERGEEFRFNLALPVPAPEPQNPAPPPPVPAAIVAELQQPAASAQQQQQPGQQEQRQLLPPNPPQPPNNNLSFTSMEQPLLDVDHTSSSLNLLTPRYLNRKGMNPDSSHSGTAMGRKSQKKALNLQQKQILVPELCFIRPFSASFWRKVVCLPCMLYPVNSLLVAEELRYQITPKAIEQADLSPGVHWPALDFGWSLIVKQAAKDLAERKALGKKGDTEAQLKSIAQAEGVINEMKSSLKGKPSIKTKSSVKTKSTVKVSTLKSKSNVKGSGSKVKSSLKTKSDAKSSIKSSLHSDMVGKKIKMMKTKKKKMPTTNEIKSKQLDAKEKSLPIGEITEEKPSLVPPKEGPKSIKEDNENEISENEKVVIEVTKEHLDKDPEKEKEKDSEEIEKENAKKAEESHNKEPENGDAKEAEESRNKEKQVIEVQPEQDKEKDSPKAEKHSPEQKVFTSNDTPDVDDNEWEYYWEEVEISGKKEYEPVDEHDLYKYNPNDILRVDLPVNKSNLNVAKEKNESNNPSIGSNTLDMEKLPEAQGPPGALVTSEVASSHEQTPTGNELADEQKQSKDKSPSGNAPTSGTKSSSPKASATSSSPEPIKAPVASPPRVSVPSGSPEPAKGQVSSPPQSHSGKQDQKPQSPDSKA